jgi:hypothetical protein
VEERVSADKGSSDAKLFRAFQLVNEWLKFGEAKNGALLTLNAAAIVGMHNIVKLYGPLDWPPILWIWWATACCLVSIAICLASFYARTKTSAFQFANQTPDGTSAIYFGHLAEMTKADLVKRLAPDVDAANREYVEDMAGQVIINAKLARKKMTLFNGALLITMAGALTPVGLLLYYWRFCDDAS